MKLGTLLLVYLIAASTLDAQDTVAINGKEFILKGEKIIENSSEKCFYEDTSFAARVYHDDGTFHFEIEEGKTIFSVERIEIRNDSLVYLEYTDCSGIKLLRLYKYSLKSDSCTVKIQTERYVDTGDEYWVVSMSGLMVDIFESDSQHGESINQVPWLILYFVNEKQAKKWYRKMK